MWRPTPLYRARQLEKALDTPAKIFFKYEGTSPAGSHKPNTAVPQAYYNAEEGIKRLTTETGAGQWGSALAFAGGLFGLEVMVYMVKVSISKSRIAVRSWRPGAPPCSPPQPIAPNSAAACSPGSPTHRGAWHRDLEAVEDAATRDDSHYSLGSVVNHVLLHQTVIGQEAQKQMEMADAYPDVVIGCVGGGSNFGSCLSVRRGSPHRQDQGLVHRSRAGGLPDADPGPVRLRLR